MHENPLLLRDDAFILSRVRTIPKKLPNTQYYWVLPIPIPNTNTSALLVAQ